MSMIVFEVLYGLAAGVGIAVFFGVVLAISLGMLVWYLRELKE
jgi:hypothetical protein